MASARLFGSLPPFPDDLQPVAEMATISLARLVSGSVSEAQAVLDACRKLGFFLLDLSGDPVGEEMIKEADAVFGIVRETMDLSLEEKEKYSQDLRKNDFLGYKAQGLMKTETGAPDRCEFFNVSQDDLLGNTIPHRATPAPVECRRGLLRSYLEHGQFALTHILRALATQLNLPAAIFRDLQPLSRPSGTIIRMIRYTPSLTSAEMRTGLLPHTDFGSVTLLANVVGGLQVLAPDSKPEDEQAWQWVRPRPGCLIVNMGDAMVQWTGGILRSNMHRVNYAPGEQRYVARFSVAMLVRPYKEAAMRRLNGGCIPSVDDDERKGLADTEENISTLTAHEWQLKKSMMLKDGKVCARSRGGREPRPLITV